MKIVEQDRKKVIVELDPVELQLLQKGISRYGRVIDKAWKNMETGTPEELLYHAARKDRADGLSRKLGSSVNMFKHWGVLK